MAEAGPASSSGAGGTRSTGTAGDSPPTGTGGPRTSRGSPESRPSIRYAHEPAGTASSSTSCPRATTRSRWSTAVTSSAAAPAWPEPGSAVASTVPSPVPAASRTASQVNRTSSPSGRYAVSVSSVDSMRAGERGHVTVGVLTTTGANGSNNPQTTASSAVAAAADSSRGARGRDGTAGGACTGAGIPPTRIDRVVAVLKAFTSRVGEGPFPTELHDATGDYLREVGHEYGTTTGRPRRIGWLDLVMGRYAQRINGVTDFVLTKLDNYDGLEEINVCVAYDVNGVRHDEMPVSQSDFHHAVPIYEEFPGWTEDISGAREFSDLPANAQAYVRFLEECSGSRISAIGVGPARDEIIQLHDLID